MKQDDLHTVNSLFSEWLTPPGDLTLSSDEVHVWRASLEMVPPSGEGPETDTFSR